MAGRIGTDQTTGIKYYQPYEGAELIALPEGVKVGKDKTTGERFIQHGDSQVMPIDAFLALQRSSDNYGRKLEDYASTVTPEKSPVLEAIGNIPASGARLAGDLWNAVTSPWETAKGLGRIAAGAAQKAAPYDIIGTGYKPYAEAVGEFYKDRYGGLDNIANTFIEDPVGGFADIAGLLTGAGGAAKGAAALGSKATGITPALQAVKNAGRAAIKAGDLIDPMMLAGKGAVKGAGKAAGWFSGAIDGLSKKLYSSAAKFGTALGRAERNNLVETAIENRIYPTQGGYDDVRDILDELSDQKKYMLDAREVLESSGEVPINIDPRVLAWETEEFLRPRYGKIPSGDSLNELYGMGEKFLNDPYSWDMWKTSLADENKHNLQLFERAHYKDMTGLQSSWNKVFGNRLRDAIERNIPDIASINKRMSDLMALLPEVERVSNRIDNSNVLGLLAPIVGSAVSAGNGIPTGSVAALGLWAAGLPKSKSWMSFRLDDTNKIINSGRRGLNQMGRKAIDWGAPYLYDAAQIGRLGQNALSQGGLLERLGEE